MLLLKKFHQFFLIFILFSSSLFNFIVCSSNTNNNNNNNFYINQTQIKWENYYSNILSNLIYKSFRYSTNLESPFYKINKNELIPCEAFSFSNINPSIYTIYSNIELIQNENNNSNYYFNEKLKCYVDNQVNDNDKYQDSDSNGGLIDKCKFNLPISRCIDNDSPNLSNINSILSFIDKGFNVKNSLKSYYSSKQSYFYYISDFLNNYLSTNQFNRSNYYWNEMIDQLLSLVNNFINLSQPNIPKNIGSILESIDSTLLSDSLKSKIINQTSFSINTILSSLNNLIIVISNFKSSSSTDPSSTTINNYSTINSTLLNILIDLNNLNDYQISCLDIYFGSTNQFENKIEILFKPGQTLLEYYLEFTTSSTFIEMIVQELLLLLDHASSCGNGNSFTISIENQQQIQLNKLKSIELNLFKISNLIKQSTGINELTPQPISKSKNYFQCNFNIIKSIFKSFNQINNNTGYSKIMTFGDIGYCRDLVENLKSITLDLTITNQLVGVDQFSSNSGADIYMYDWGNNDGVRFITSSLFGKTVKSTDALFYFSQNDGGWVLNITYPKSSDKPIIYPNPPPLTLPPVGNYVCPYPTCAIVQSDCIMPSNSYYYDFGLCDICQAIPDSCVRTFHIDNMVGISPQCPYVCRLARQYKLGPLYDYNFRICADTPIGYYTPAMNNSLNQCTIPLLLSTLSNRLGFGSNAASDNCLVTPKYQLVFVNSDYNTPRNVIPTSVLNRGTTIEMWIKINKDSLPTSNTVIGLTGVYESWELSLLYTASNKTIVPAITNPTTQDVLFKDSTSQPSITIPDTFFHFAVIIETNNIISFYMNGKKVGRSIFTTTSFSAQPGYQYIGSLQFNRMSFLIDEFKTYNRALSPNQLGYKNTNEMLEGSCNSQTKETLCQSNCIASCNPSNGLLLNSTDCTCQCNDPINMELINTDGHANGICLPKCPKNSFRNLNDPTVCDCIDGEFKVLKTMQVKISSIYPYDSLNNYYQNNIDKKIGLLGVKIFNELGESVKPISCSSSSNDGNGNVCNNLFDLDANSYWCTSSQSGNGYVILNLETPITISKITIIPLPNPTTMKQITISISTEISNFNNFEILVLNSTLPLLQVVNADNNNNNNEIEYSSINNGISTFNCVSCPTKLKVKESPLSPDYNYPPISSLPRNRMNSCGCFGRFSFDISTSSCMPPLPSPTFTLPSGPYKTNTLVNVIYDIQITKDYTLRYTIDSSDPIESSPTFPQQQGITFNEIETVVLKVRSFKTGRLTSDVASVIYQIQGLINCTLSPKPSNPAILMDLYNVSVVVFINCETTPTISSISSSWIYYTTDSSEPSLLSNKYNPKYGVNLIAEPTIGMNYITFRVLSKLDQYFSFNGDFLYKIQPIIPPPIISPPNEINFTNSVPLVILVPSIIDTVSTSITTPIYYKNYSIFYDVIGQGITDPAPLNSTFGLPYKQDDYIVVQCITPELGCLLHLRAIGCINEACSKITHKYFKLSFDFNQLTPTILSKYQSTSNSFLITIKSNSLLIGLETYYQFKLFSNEIDLNYCQSSFDIQLLNSLLYVSPFNLSSIDKGYFCICSKNFKNFNNNLYSSKQICKVLTYTYQMDPPIYLQYGEYIENQLEFMIYPNIKNYRHVGLFRVEINNGDATEDSQTLNGSIILNLSPSLSYQRFSISSIDCPRGFICSEPSLSEILLRDRCKEPYVSKPSGYYYKNVTIYGNCDNGCTPVIEFINSSSAASSSSSDLSVIPPSPQSQIFPPSLFLSSPDSEETTTIFLMMCVNTYKANSVVKDFMYTVSKYLRPNKPIIKPENGGFIDSSKGQMISMSCTTIYPGEECFIYFTIKYINSKSNVPLEINADPQPASSIYDYQYVKPFAPNFVGNYYIVAITTVEKTTQPYDYYYSTENAISITVYGNRPLIKMIPNVSLFYPSIEITLISSSTTTINDLIFIYISNQNDTYYSATLLPPLNEFKPYDSIISTSPNLTINIFENTTIFAYLQGKYYGVINDNSIQQFSLYYDKEKEIDNQSSSSSSPINNHSSSNNLLYLLLLLLLIPIGYLIYKFIIHKYYLRNKFLKLVKQSIKTGLIIKKSNYIK